MIERLQELSKVIVLPAAILYALGFLVEAAYLARFGMINFDIFNARFLIAGIFPAIALTLAMLVAWEFYKVLPSNSVFARAQRVRKYAAYLIVTFGTYFTCFILSFIFKLGEYRAPASEKLLQFSPFLRSLIGKFDIAGYLLSFIPKLTPGVDFIMRASLYLAFYALLVAAVVWLTIAVKNFFFTRLQEPIEPTVGEEKIKTKTGENPEWLNGRIGLAIDIVAISFVFATFSYCALKVSASTFDFHSFEQGYKISASLLMAWMFPSVIFFYLFLNFTWKADQQLTFETMRQYGNSSDIGDMLQQLIYPLLLSIFLFGAVIFPRIPYSMGGGMPRGVQIGTDVTAIIASSSEIYLLDESSQYLFLVSRSSNGSTAFQLNKDDVEYFITRATTTPMEAASSTLDESMIPTDVEPRATTTVVDLKTEVID